VRCGGFDAFERIAGTYAMCKLIRFRQVFKVGNVTWRAHEGKMKTAVPANMFKLGCVVASS
jgi:hypothetical protein